MPRFFTLAQAEAALPNVEKLVREALFCKAEHDRAATEIRDISIRVQMSGGVRLDPEKVLSVRQLQEQSAARVNSIVETLQESGCLIKDLDVGLLDFPTLYRGEEVYLCWRLGEKSIEYWHAIADGFRGRKPIDQEFLDNHVGDQTA